MFPLFLYFSTAKNLRKYVEAYMNRKDVSEKLSQVKTLGKNIPPFSVSLSFPPSFFPPLLPEEDSSALQPSSFSLSNPITINLPSFAIHK